MLKIKDNVNLRKLKKYGFVRCEPDEYYRSKEDENEKSARYIYWENGFGVMDIEESTRRIWAISNYDILFDLITDGLVEKIEEKGLEDANK